MSDFFIRPLVVRFDGRYSSIMEYQAQTIDFPIIIKNNSLHMKRLKEDIVIDASLPYWIISIGSKNKVNSFLRKILDCSKKSRFVFIPKNHPKIFKILNSSEIQRAFDIFEGKYLKEAANMLTYPIGIEDTFFNIAPDYRNGIIRETQMRTMLRIFPMVQPKKIIVFGLKRLMENIEVLRTLGVPIFFVSENFNDTVICRNRYSDVKAIMMLEYNGRMMGKSPNNLTVPLIKNKRNVEYLARAYRAAFSKFFLGLSSFSDKKVERIIISIKNSVEYHGLRYVFPGMQFERIRVSCDPDDAIIKPGYDGTRTIYSYTSFDADAIFMDDGYHIRKYFNDTYDKGMIGKVIIFDVRG